MLHTSTRTSSRHAPCPRATLRRVHRLLRSTGVLLLVALFALAIASSVATARSKKPAKTHWSKAELAQITASATEKKFSLSKQDIAAIATAKRGKAIASEAQRQHDTVAVYDARIARIDVLLADAAGDEARLRQQLESQLLAEYKSSDPTGWNFILGANGIADAASRASVVKDRMSRQQALVASHDASLVRLESLRFALQDLSNVKGTAAANLDTQATDLEGTLIAAREAHINEVVEMESTAGVPGTWYVLGTNVSSAVSSAWSGAYGSAYGGGTRTPARPATPEQISTILADPRVQIYAGGIGDIQSGRVDGRVIDALEGMAEQFGSIIITSLISGHGTYTASGNVSEHSFGCAADIGSVSGIRIERGTQGPGTITETAVKYLAGLQGDLAPHQVISLYSYGGASMALADHYDHIHLGYSCG